MAGYLAVIILSLVILSSIERSASASVKDISFATVSEITEIICMHFIIQSFLEHEQDYVAASVP
jgi:hypothetical protein